MDKELEPHIADVLLSIGEQVKELRKTRTNYNYKQLSENLTIGQNTYLRIEKGHRDYNISNLIAVVDYYKDIKLSDILRKAGL